MAKLSDFGIKGIGTGLLLPYTIPGEPKESYERRCELDKIRNMDIMNPNDAEIEYQLIRDIWLNEYWLKTKDHDS